MWWEQCLNVPPNSFNIFPKHIATFCSEENPNSVWTVPMIWFWFLAYIHLHMTDLAMFLETTTITSLLCRKIKCFIERFVVSHKGHLKSYLLTCLFTTHALPISKRDQREIFEELIDKIDQAIHYIGYLPSIAGNK